MFILSQDREYLINTDNLIDIYAKNGTIYATAQTAGEDCAYNLGQYEGGTERNAIRNVMYMLRDGGGIRARNAGHGRTVG